MKYTPGVGSIPQNLRQLLRDRAEREPESVAFQFEKNKHTEAVTCARFCREVDTLGAFFVHEGFSRQRIAILGDNSYEWLLACFAVMLSGNVVVPLDRQQSADTLSELLKRCEASAVVCSKTYGDIAAQLLSAGAVSRVISMDDIPSILEGGASAPLPPAEDDAVCALLYTSGTEGEAKGVMLTQRNIASNAVHAYRSYMKGGSSVLTLPLHHAFGLTVGAVVTYYCGHPIYISKGLRHFMRELTEQRPYVLVLVPLYVETMYKTIWKQVREQGQEKQLRRLIRISNALRKVGVDLRRVLFRPVLDAFGGELRLILCGGAFLEQEYVDGLDDLGVTVLRGYGITECSPIVSVNRIGAQRAESVGPAIEGCEVKIVDGEVCVRGDGVMAGYWGDEAATADAMEDGWFKTGDLGRLDEDGYLYITGRKKNLIILSNGENVSAEELERRLTHIEGVAEAVVREEDGVITAELYAPDAPDAEAAVAALNRTLPPYQRIGKVRLRETEFVKTTTQKIRRDMDSARENALPTYPLLATQLDMYAFDRFNGGAACVLCGSVLVKGSIEPERLQYIANELYRCNDALRARIVETADGPAQTFPPFVGRTFEVMQFPDKASLDRFGNDWAGVVPPLLGDLSHVRLVLLPDRFGIVLKMHHIVSDGWTMRLLGRQFLALLDGKELHAGSYRDFIARQTAYWKSERFRADKAFGDEMIERLGIPGTRMFDRPKLELVNGSQAFSMSAEETRRIAEYARTHSTTPTALFSAALGVYVSRRMALPSAAFGINSFNRVGLLEKNTAGMFMLATPVEITPAEDRSFAENIAEATTSTLASLRHGAYLTEPEFASQNNKKLKVDILFSFQEGTPDVESVETAWYRWDAPFIPGVLMLTVIALGDAPYQLVYDYNVRVPSADEITEMHRTICAILLEGVADDQKPLRELGQAK